MQILTLKSRLLFKVLPIIAILFLAVPASWALDGQSEEALANERLVANNAEQQSSRVAGYVGLKVIAGTSGANVRSSTSAIRFLQTPGVHGTIVGNSVSMTINGAAQKMWPVLWDSAPANYASTSSHGYSAESVLEAAPAGSDVARPNLYSTNYSTRNTFFPNFAPNTNPPGGNLNSQGNCTWYAYGRILELGFDKTKFDAWLGFSGRDANQWEAKARAGGITVSSVPVVNSIAATAAGSQWGHVAVVEAVHSDGRITISESNYSSTNDLSSPWNITWRRRTTLPTAGSTPFYAFIVPQSASVGRLTVSPDTNLSSSGSVGGPFSPSSITYQLTNSGSSSLTWTASTSNSSVASVSPSSGTIQPGKTVDATVSVPYASGSLSAGSYSAQISFGVQSGGTGSAARAVNLTVTPSGQKAVITSPTPGSTLPGSTATFNWSQGTNVQGYRLSVGTSVGAADIYGSSLLQSVQSQTVTGLPTNGAAVYVRLQSLISGNWQSADYTYTASYGLKAAITSPVPGSQLAGSTTTFSWTTGTGVSSKWLYVGTSFGAYDIFASGVSGSSVTVSNIPSGTVHVTLWSLIAGDWQSNTYVYTGASDPRAKMTSPSQGSSINPTTTFSWTQGSGVSAYVLYVGTSFGQRDIFASGVAGTSTTVSNIPSGTIHVTLWSLISGQWQYNTYTYTGVGSHKAKMTSPLQGASIGRTTAFYWTKGSNTTAVYIYVGTSFGGKQIYSSGVAANSTTVSNIPSGTIHVTLWSLVLGVWEHNTYTYNGTGIASFDLKQSALTE